MRQTVSRDRSVRTACAAFALTMLGVAAPAQAAASDKNGTQTNVVYEIAFVRAGNVYTSRGTTEKQLTTGGGAARPRWSPDGKRIAYLSGGRLWVMNADGSARRQLSRYSSGGPSWSPDGKWLAFAALGCTGGPVVYKISTTAAKPKPSVVFPADCKSEPLPEPESPAPATGTLLDRLAVDDAVSWSPDGKKIAFRGGLCESVYDACLTVGTVATAAEQTVAAYGGGGKGSGFATIPNWRPDGARLTWTTTTGTKAASGPLGLVEFDPTKGTRRPLGAPGDRELSYRTTRTAFLTGERSGRSWIYQIDTATSFRVPLRQGSQPDPRP